MKLFYIHGAFTNIDQDLIHSKKKQTFDRPHDYDTKIRNNNVQLYLTQPFLQPK